MAAVTLATSCSKDDDNNAPEKKQNASPQEKTIIYNPDGTVTIPYSIKYSTGKSLDKKMTYSDDGMLSKYVPTEGDEIIVSGEGVSGTLTLQYELSDFGGREEVFKGNLTATSPETATKLTNNEITLTYEYGTALEEPASSNVSLQDLMESCNHLYTATGKYSDESFTLSDQNAYLAISMSPCCKHDITINDNDFTVEDGRIWIAVPGGKPVKSTGLGTELDKAAKDVVPGTIHTVARQYFTVSSEGKKVYFSKGNLQYNASADPQWRFAENQYDICHKSNDEVGNNYKNWKDKWTDLFGWGTWLSGSNPYETQNQNAESYVWNSNATSAIGEEWYTLSGSDTEFSEWFYLIKKRDGKYGEGSVDKVSGVILLPDDWTLPSGVGFKSGSTEWYNTYTKEQWAAMEANGAVFLPAAGSRRAGSVDRVGTHGYYWSSSIFDNKNAWYLNSSSKYVNTDLGGIRCYGYSVRLVRPL